MTRAPFTLVATALAMLAFAGNSILCRLALATDAIDPAPFTFVRILSGAVALALIVAWRERESTMARLRASGDWLSAFALVAYAAGFSFAYVTLHASMGALILFGVVQATMIGVALARGERLTQLQALGAVAAAAGLVYLLSPGLSAPTPLGAALMALAGVAWGVYSLRGAAQKGDPTAVTAANFLRGAPIAAALALAFLHDAHWSAPGVFWATLSGALTSGVGYAVWYAALRGLARSEAAIVQLTVPLIAAAGGMLFLAEPLSARFAIASAAILGGVALVLLRRKA
jgi:drug/metabolite transporter (DMT)-like permease